MKQFKNILLISGTGRNCGKTTMACNIINLMHKKRNVFGLKITPHFHVTSQKQQLVDEGIGYKIFREIDTQSDKDSSRMLRAGAKEVYFIQCVDINLEGMYERMLKLIPAKTPVVCESGSFAKVFKPGLHILLTGNTTKTVKSSYKANLKTADIIIKRGEMMLINHEYIFEFSDNQWIAYNKQAIKIMLN